MTEVNPCKEIILNKSEITNIRFKPTNPKIELCKEFLDKMLVGIRLSKSDSPNYLKIFLNSKIVITVECRSDGVYHTIASKIHRFVGYDTWDGHTFGGRMCKTSEDVYKSIMILIKNDKDHNKILRTAKLERVLKNV